MWGNSYGSFFQSIAACSVVKVNGRLVCMLLRGHSCLLFDVLLYPTPPMLYHPLQQVYLASAPANTAGMMCAVHQIRVCSSPPRPLMRERGGSNPSVMQYAHWQTAGGYCDMAAPW
eukprot:GDKI01034736.1.p1 GENE.GDKI01034736.1~~GDKI01034736.1.p1  ORF type:complete len:116 (+),score=12.69 GDKI01034736.1:391-738(+)